MKVKYLDSIPSNLNLVAGLLSAFLCFCLFVACASTEVPKDIKELADKTISTDTTIQVTWEQEIYELTLDTSYSISSGLGDDTQFLQIVNADGSLIFGNETGLTVIVPKSYSKLELAEIYDELIEIKAKNQQTYLLGINDKQYNFRNKAGAFFIPKAGKFISPLNFSSSTERVKGLVELLRTFSQEGN